MRKIENKIITDKIINAYIQKNKLYVIFYSDIDYDITTKLCFFNLDLKNIECDIIKKEICIKSNLLVYTCETQNVDILYDIRKYININISYKIFNVSDAFKSATSLSNINWF